MFKVEKGIPIPRSTFRRGKYPFDKMSVGDSFQVGSSTDDAKRARSAVYNAKKSGKVPEFARFSIQLNGDVYRCWRVE